MFVCVNGCACVCMYVCVRVRLRLSLGFCVLERLHGTYRPAFRFLFAAAELVRSAYGRRRVCIMTLRELTRGVVAIYFVQKRNHS